MAVKGTADGTMVDVTIDPPNSRLFILCSKTTTEDELRETFQKYGTIEDIWIVKDRSSNESKGVVYIKFSKSSEAALAMEEMTGKTPGSGGKPFKVMIAHSREQGSRREDDPDRLQRLFIVVPRTATEDDIREHFKQFGDLDYVSIVRKRETGESKGVAYVKYLRAYHAAKAFEECNRSYKAVFARPKEKSQNFDSSEGRSHQRFHGPPQTKFQDSGANRWSGGGDQLGETRLIALLDLSLKDEQIYRLFDIAPGLVDIRPQANRNYYGLQKVLVEYNCPPAANHAVSKINGLEYPLGSRISVKPYSQGMMCPDEMKMPTKDMNGAMSSPSGMTTISNNELATLTAALAKAEAIIKSNNFGTNQLLSSPNRDFEEHDLTYCSVALPPPKPLVQPTDEPTHRLFIVCQPGLPSRYALRDVFGRFGSLIEVYTLQGKNCGYVTYATKESADKAIKTLHLQEVCGMRIKVMVAEPPKSRPSDRKRLRSDQDSDN